jgi:hypothetical protein
VKIEREVSLLVSNAELAKALGYPEDTKLSMVEWWEEGHLRVGLRIKLRVSEEVEVGYQGPRRLRGKGKEIKP